MNLLVGDIGNTIIKLCLIKDKSFKISKIIYLNSSSVCLKSELKKNLNKILKNKSVNKIALFSSVVPKYQKIIKNDFQELLSEWDEINSKFMLNKAPEEIYNDYNFSKIIVRDLFNDDINKLIIDNKSIYNQ